MMATRPVFLPTRTGAQLFQVRSFDFRWSSGFAEIQKKKNITALHNAAQANGISNILEISTKSDIELGRRLSAFSLKFPIRGELFPMECVYQSSKVFENGGPYLDLINKTPIECKRDPRIRQSGRVLFFSLDGNKFDSTPFNAFYDWIYINCLNSHEGFLMRRLERIDGFTDIEFNPEKSLNCQARALAILVSLSYRGWLQRSAQEFNFFRSKVSETFNAL